MRLAVMQMQAGTREPEDNLDLIEKAMSEAAEKGAQALLAPELAITGYGAGKTMDDHAQPRDGAWFQRLQAHAQATGIAVIAGFPERAGDAVYNSAFLLDSSPGGAAVIYRKSHLYGDYERRLFTPAPPETVLADLAGIRLGMLICYDVEFPENVRRLAIAGADAVLVPTALPQGPHAAFIAKSMIATRAFENQIFVAYANYAGRDEAFAYAGLSSVAAPDGETLAAADAKEHDFLMADIDPTRYAESRSQNTYLNDI